MLPVKPAGKEQGAGVAEELLLELLTLLLELLKLDELLLELNDELLELLEDESP